LVRWWMFRLRRESI